MSLVLYESGAVRVEVKYLQKKGAVWYFRRRIPDDVKRLYPGKKGVLFFSLKTSDPLEAAKRADVHARQQDALWRSHRSGAAASGPDLQKAALGLLQSHNLKPGQWSEFAKADIEPDRFLEDLSYLSDGEDGQIVRERLPEHASLAADLFYGAEKKVHFLSEALKLHQELVGEEAGTQSHYARVRSVQRFMDQNGDMHVESYTREHARTFVNGLLAEGKKTATVKRYVNYVSPVFSTAIREYDLAHGRIFEGLRIPKLGEDSEERIPFTTEELRIVQQACITKDDEIRWLLALITDTGMRLGEAVGLERQDILLEHEVPHVFVRPTDSRRLKSKGSERRIPLVGLSLWAARRFAARGNGKHVIARYVVDGDPEGTSLKATFASNTLCSWIKRCGVKKPVHSFRHTMRDRLRNVNAPEEVADRIGGWSNKSVGQSYGQGHSLTVLHEWMLKTEDRATLPPD